MAKEELDLREDDDKEAEESVKVELEEKKDTAPKKEAEKVEPEDKKTDGDEDDDKGLEGKTDDEREEIRSRRREERRARKEYQKARDREIEFLRRQNGELSTRIGAIENRNFGSDIARIDHAILDAESQIEQAKEIIKKAAVDQNGEAMAQAQDALYVARRRHEDLNALKGSIAQNQRRPQPMNPVMANHAKDWMTKNNWFDPKGRDADSRVALTIDNLMAEEGWNPVEKEYWEELSTRLQRHLPHRFSGGGSSTTTTQRQTTTGSDRDGAGASKSAYVLSGERVRAMKEAGMWDQFQSDAVFKARMLKRFREQDEKGKTS